MDYPEEREKSAFIPTEPNRTRDFSRRISKAADLLSPWKMRCLFVYDRARVIYRFRQCIIFRQCNVSNAYKNTFNIITYVTETWKDLSLGGRWNSLRDRSVCNNNYFFRFVNVRDEKEDHRVFCVRLTPQACHFKRGPFDVGLSIMPLSERYYDRDTALYASSNIHTRE